MRHGSCASASTAALFVVFALPALAQTPSDDARRFLVYPPNQAVRFTAGDEGRYYLLYSGAQTRKGDAYYNQVIQVTRHANEAEAVANCEAQRKVEIPGKTVRMIEGYPCAFVQEHKVGSGANATHYRSSWYAKGNYFVTLGEGAMPRSLMPATPPVGPLLAALGGGPSLPRAEVVFRADLLEALGLQSVTAKSCLDEVMDTVEADARKDATMADQVARLRKAAGRVHAIKVLAAVPLDGEHYDDFDAKWWDGLKEIAPNPWAPPDPEETATDWAQELLPWPLGLLVDVARKGAKTMRSIKTHIVSPAMHGALYRCYRNQRVADGKSRIHDGMSRDALEAAAAETFLDGTVTCPYVNDFRSSYERDLRAFKGEARDREFKQLIRPVAFRFETIWRVEDAKANKDRLIRDSWAPVDDLLGRLKNRVNACIAERR